MGEDIGKKKRGVVEVVKEKKRFWKRNLLNNLVHT